MKTMNIMMPLMSVFFCFTFSSGIGVYWIASSVVMILIQMIVNKYMERIDINQMVEKETDYAPLVRELNELMQEYNKLLSTRSQLPKGDDTKKTDTEVFADTVSV